MTKFDPPGAPRTLALPIDGFTKASGGPPLDPKAFEEQQKTQAEEIKGAPPSR